MAPAPLSFKTLGGGGVAYKDQAWPPPPVGGPQPNTVPSEGCPMAPEIVHSLMDDHTGPEILAVQALGAAATAKH